MLLLLTLQKGGFRQGNTMLLKGDSDCCCCAHKNTAQAFPGAGTSLLKSRKSLLYVSRFLDAGYWELLLLCPQRHGPPGRGNTMALKDEWSPK